MEEGKVQESWVIEDSHPQGKLFHTRQRRGSAQVDAAYPLDTILQAPYELSKRDQRFLKSLISIHGVASASIHGYTLAILLARAFSWEEILPGIEAVLRRDAEERDKVGKDEQSA